MKDHLFLDGTLLPALAPPALRKILGQLRPLAPGSMPGRMYDIGDFPGAVFDATARTRVYGQVFELPDDHVDFGTLDEYEGYSPNSTESSLFVRERQPIKLAEGTELLCWVYVYNRDPGQALPVPSGHYPAWICRAPKQPLVVANQTDP